MNAESKSGPTRFEQLYGSMVSVFDTGVLLLGESGIGKSETSLELISRGHSLVADDAVVLTLLPDSRINGKAPEITSRILEIRGLGIIDVSEIFGDTSYREDSELCLCVELRTPQDFEVGQRLIPRPVFENVLGVEVPKVVLPVRRGRNIPVLIETAVKIFLAGKPPGQTAAELVERYNQSLSKNTEK